VVDDMEIWDLVYKKGQQDKGKRRESAWEGSSGREDNGEGMQQRWIDSCIVLGIGRGGFS